METSMPPIFPIFSDAGMASLPSQRNLSNGPGNSETTHLYE
jgi:hypothetical protein